VEAAIEVFPPLSRPVISRGALPLFFRLTHFAPRPVRAFIKGPIGRVWIWSSPVKVMVWPGRARAAEPSAIRRVVPEFATSIVSSGALILPPVPVTFQSLGSVVSISAPKAR